MSEIAAAAGIGRATLYKYFPDVDAILVAWHERQIAGHLEQLAALGKGSAGPGERLRAVLEAYAFIQHESHGHEMAAVLHRGDHVAHAVHQLRAFLGELMLEAAAAGVVRDDVAVDELASYAVHALATAGSLPSKAAVRRLVGVTLDGLAPRA
jgi:AcrR family transcriptional regulator